LLAGSAIQPKNLDKGTLSESQNEVSVRDGESQDSIFGSVDIRPIASILKAVGIIRQSACLKKPEREEPANQFDTAMPRRF
jgi:hypothetical protein